MEDIFGNTPLVVRRHHPDSFKATIDWHLRNGDLVRMLPGVHRRKELEETFEVRVLALAQWQPDAILLAGTAAKFTWWPELRIDKLLAAAKDSGEITPWLATQRRSIKPELFTEHEGIRAASAEFSILEMSVTDHGTAMSEGLRRGVTTMESLLEVNETLPKNLRGASARNLVLDACRAKPWSGLEINAHRLLREAKITGWKANHKVIIDGKSYYIDLAFVSERIAIELDGPKFHGPGQREAELERQNDLVRAGWTVLRFTDATVDMLVDVSAPVIRSARANWRRRPLPEAILSAVPVTSDPDPDGSGSEEWHVA